MQHPRAAGGQLPGVDETDLYCALGLQADVKSSCPDAKPEAGEVQECLASHRPLLSWDCQEQLFRQEVENAEDLRLSVRLFRACLADKKKARHLSMLTLPPLQFTADVCGSQLYRKGHLASVLQGCLALYQKFVLQSNYAYSHCALQIGQGCST